MLPEPIFIRLTSYRNVDDKNTNCFTPYIMVDACKVYFLIANHDQRGHAYTLVRCGPNEFSKVLETPEQIVAQLDEKLSSRNNVYIEKVPTTGSRIAQTAAEY